MSIGVPGSSFDPYSSQVFHPNRTTSPPPLDENGVPQSPPGSPSPETPPATSTVSHYGSSNFDPTSGLPPGMVADDLLNASQLQTTESLRDMANYIKPIDSNDPSQVAEVPAEKKEMFDSIAKHLGFNDFKMMQYQLRNLPEHSKRSLFSQLTSAVASATDAQGNSTPELIKEKVTRRFDNFMHMKINELFTGANVPMPQYRPGTDQFNGAALSSVFNALTEIKESSPEKFRTIALSAGTNEAGEQIPLTFQKENPNPDQIKAQMQENFSFNNIFNEAMYIAHADPKAGVVTISDTAISGNTEDVTQFVAGKVALISEDRMVRDANGNEGLSPEYTPDELSERGFDDMSKQEIRDLLADPEFLNRFGEARPDGSHSGVELLQYALRFVIKYRGLKDFESIKHFHDNPPDVDGKMGPATLGALNAISQYSTKGKELLLSVMCRLEQMHTVQSMQEYMRDNTPFGSESNLDTDGMIGTNTKKAVRQFQLAMGLNLLKERIEDDPLIPEQKKVEYLEYFEQQFAAVADNPDRFRSVAWPQVHTKLLESLQLAELNPPLMTQHTADLIRQDISKFQSMSDGRISNENMNYMVGNWFNVMDSGHGVDMGEQLVSHELSHLWQNSMDQNNQDVLTNWSRLFDAQPGESSFGTGQMNRTDYNDGVRSDKTSASDYGSVSAEEDFAEASRIFTYDPQRLMRRSLTKFMMMNSLHDKPFNDNQILTMARESGYSDAEINESIQTIRGYGSVEFTLEMASRLSDDYEGLDTLLNGSNNDPNTIRFEPTVFGPQNEPVSPEETTFQPQSSPDSSGYSLEYLQHKYLGMVERLQDAWITPVERYQVEQELAAFEQNFIQNGFAAFEDIPASAVAALEAKLPPGQDPQQSRAALLQMAKMRTMPQASVTLEPSTRQYLPDNFKMLLDQDTRFSNIISNDHRLSPSSVVNDSFKRMGELNLEIESQFKTASSRASRVAQTGRDNLNSLAARYGLSPIPGPQMDDFMTHVYKKNETPTSELLAFMQDPTAFMSTYHSEKMGQEIQSLAALGSPDTLTEAQIQPLLELVQAHQGYQQGPPPPPLTLADVQRFLSQSSELSPSSLPRAFASWITVPELAPNPYLP